MNKMVVCKTCGAQIAKTANRCPNCGAQQHQAALTACALIIVFTFVLIIAVVAGASNDSVNNAKNRGASAASTSSSPVPVTISADELWQAYSDNEVNADNIYKGQLLAVTGTITNIGKDIVTGNPCVSLDSGSQYNIYPIQCFFTSDSKNSETLAALKDGQTITIQGTCSGAPVSYVQLTHCQLSE